MFWCVGLARTMGRGHFARGWCSSAPRVPAEGTLGRPHKHAQANIRVFKTAEPSVVSVTNLTLRRDAFTMSLLEFPQGGACKVVCLALPPAKGSLCLVVPPPPGTHQAKRCLPAPLPCRRWKRLCVGGRDHRHQLPCASTCACTCRVYRRASVCSSAFTSWMHELTHSFTAPTPRRS